VNNMEPLFFEQLNESKEVINTHQESLDKLKAEKMALNSSASFAECEKGKIGVRAMPKIFVQPNSLHSIINQCEGTFCCLESSSCIVSKLIMLSESFYLVV